MDTLAPIGFIGLGAMGEPLALNLAKSGKALVAWNRSPEKAARLIAAGAKIASDPNEVFLSCPIIFLMLADEPAIDATLARHCANFANQVRERIIINMATVSPDYSAALEADIMAAGGQYVEAPVSGSRLPAEAGQLVAMLAGDSDVIARVQPLFAPMCRSALFCGVVPRALAMKFAVNIFLISSMTGLAESANFARAQGLDMPAWASIVNASQMVSDISKVKTAKLIANDFSAQAAIANVLETNRLIADAAHRSGIAAPIMDVCLNLYRQAKAQELGSSDMIAVVKAFEAMSHSTTD